MTRVKRGVTSHARHKKVLKQVKGQYGRRKNTISFDRMVDWGIDLQQQRLSGL